ncbi:hypothetical protein LTR17_023053 [Elasticomyces elasticus]|nr:hypothetical protein LTR17_023053 [Elasticomyces elasticus]
MAARQQGLRKKIGADVDAEVYRTVKDKGAAIVAELVLKGSSVLEITERRILGSCEADESESDEHHQVDA